MTTSDSSLARSAAGMPQSVASSPRTSRVLMRPLATPAAISLELAGGEAVELRAVGVRITVLGNQEAVAFLRAGEQYVVKIDAESRGQPVGEEEFLVGHASGGDHGGRAGRLLQLIRRPAEWRGPIWRATPRSSTSGTLMRSWLLT